MTRLVNNLLDLGRIEAGIGLQVEKSYCRRSGFPGDYLAPTAGDPEELAANP